jgi:hypothetical protein
LAYEPFHRAIMGMGVALWRTPAALTAIETSPAVSG